MDGFRRDSQNQSGSRKAAHIQKESQLYYNRSLNYKDMLYCNINAIEPGLIKHPYSSDSESSSSSSSNFEFIDPRTKEKVEDLFIDHSISSPLTEKEIRSIQNINLHHTPINSSFSKVEQMACFRVLKEQQFSNLQSSYGITSANDVTEIDRKIFKNTDKTRNKEYNDFNKFLENRENSKNELQFRRRFLNHFYNFYLNKKIEMLLKSPNYNYSVQFALPLEFHQVNDVIFDRKEIINTNSQMNYIEMHYLLPRVKHYDKYEDVISADIKNEISTIRDCDEIKPIAIDRDIDVIINESTLQFLMCCNEYELEKLWYIPFTIEKRSGKTNSDCDESVIIFDEILPLGLNNLENLNLIFEKLFEIFMTTNSAKIHNATTSKNELYAIDLKRNYELVKFDEYLNQFNSSNDKKNLSLYPRANFNLVQWSLKNIHEETPLNILTKKRITVKNNDDNHLVNYSFKLENKSQFGAEVMTKFELIREWIREFLTPDPSYTERYRLEVNTLKPILKEKLSKTEIESELLRLWNIKPSQLMSKFHSFLSLLKINPAGNYILKYDPTYKDKILVYKKTEERISDKDITLHDLYRQSENNTLDFLNEKFISIDQNVITPLHYEYEILPGCFSYLVKEQPEGSQRKICNRVKKGKTQKINQKLEEKKQKKEERLKMLKSKRSKVKHEKRAKKLKEQKGMEVEFEGTFDF